MENYKVNIADVLDNKEQRVIRQQKLIKKYGLPLISFTINMPGPIKNNQTVQEIFNCGITQICQTVKKQAWNFKEEILLTDKITGPEALWAVENCPDLMLLKKSLIELEQDLLLGRLMDIDIVSTDGHQISRKGLKIPERRCLLCGENAKVCARSRKHSVDELVTQIEKMVKDYQAQVKTKS